MEGKKGNGKLNWGCGVWIHWIQSMCKREMWVQGSTDRWKMRRLRRRRIGNDRLIGWEELLIWYKGRECPFGKKRWWVRVRR